MSNTHISRDYMLVTVWEIMTFKLQVKYIVVHKIKIKYQPRNKPTLNVEKLAPYTLALEFYLVKCLLACNFPLMNTILKQFWYSLESRPVERYRKHRISMDLLAATNTFVIGRQHSRRGIKLQIPTMDCFKTVIYNCHNFYMESLIVFMASIIYYMFINLKPPFEHSPRH